MSEYEYGNCNYCGSYRPLKYHGGYCSLKCYKNSGQQEADETHSENVDNLWYYRDDLMAIIIRTLYMTAGWTLFLCIWIGRCQTSVHISDLWILLVISGLFSILQNIIMRNRGKFFRCIILYGLPIIFFILLYISETILHGFEF